METINIGQGLEYIVLHQNQHILWYDGRSMLVTVARDCVTGRRFALYPVSVLELILRWLPELRISAYYTPNPKVYGIMFKRPAEVFLVLRLPEEDKESLRMFLTRYLCDDQDMDIVKELTEHLFAEIMQHHSQGVADLGITQDTVYVNPHSFNIVEIGNLSNAVFRWMDERRFTEAKVRDVRKAQEILLFYLNRLPFCPLYFALQAPVSICNNIRIRGTRITQVSCDHADQPGFINLHAHAWYPRGLLNGAHQLYRTQANQVAVERVAQLQSRANTNEEEEPVNVLQPAPPVSMPPPEDMHSVNQVPPPLQKTNSKSLTVQVGIAETEEFSSLLESTEQWSSEEEENSTDDEELMTDGAISIDQGQLSQESVPIATGISTQDADSGVRTWELSTDMADYVDEYLAPD
ncbi:uncharacterized protein LOC135480638 isoform X2 [Liolophura sinensis]|uniref:uncharacterized protein LOC135480638 isoform X2 n=1 Tax=Liolophura sinensis TaxID=3198878 RepID=UPI003157F30F